MNEIVSSDLPSAQSLGAIESASEVAALLARPDLPDNEKSWWLVLISVCTTGLVTAESGAVDAPEWATLLIRALDTAESRGVLPAEDVLHRRMMAHVAAMKYFGVRAGDSVRDPELVLDWFARRFDDDPDALEEELKRAASLRGSPPSEEVHRRIRRLSSVKTALKSVCELVDLIESEPQKSRARKWCGILNSYVVGDLT